MKKILLLFVFCLCFSIMFSQKLTESKNDLTYLYIEALKNKTFGNLQQAGYLFNKYNKVDSNCYSCLYEISKIYLQTVDINGALYFAYKSYHSDSSNYWYAKNFADILILIERYKESLDIYKRINKFHNKSIDDQFVLGYLYLKLNYKKEGFFLLDSLEKIKGFSEKIEFEKYRYFFQNKEYKNALAVLKNIINHFPDSYYIYGLMAENYALLKNVKSADANYNLFLSYEPNNFNAYISYGFFLIENKDTLLGFNYLRKIFINDSIQLKEKIEAFKSLVYKSRYKLLLKEFVEKNISVIVNACKDTSAAYEIACDYFEYSKNFDECLRYSNKLIESDFENPLYYERLFFYLNILNRYDSILAISQKILPRFSDRPFLYLITGVSLNQNHEYKGSINILKSGYFQAKENSEIRRQLINLLAETYYKIGKVDSSFFYFEIALEDKNTEINVFNNYAYYLALNDVKLIKALEISRIVINKYPKNSSYLDTYAWICYKLGNYEDALKYIELAYKFSRNENVEIMEHYGDILFCNNKKSKAINMWRKVEVINKISGFTDNKIQNVICK